jgi:hypothetical protein
MNINNACFLRRLVVADTDVGIFEDQWGDTKLDVHRSINGGRSVYGIKMWGVVLEEELLMVSPVKERVERWRDDAIRTVGDMAKNMVVVEVRSARLSWTVPDQPAADPVQP